MNNSSRVIVALDGMTLAQTVAFIRSLGTNPAVAMFKVGRALLERYGTEVLLVNLPPGRYFLDGKQCDIPNTCREAAHAHTYNQKDDLAPLQVVAMTNVMACAGIDAMRAVKSSVARHTKVIAVTVLTSISAEECQRIYGRSPEVMAIVFAEMAHKAGLDGVVASPNEAAHIRSIQGPDFLIVTPGVRPPGSTTHDQQRIDTPAGAIRAGSDYVVVGRPITQAPNPLEALMAINAEVAQAFAAY
jgi:orotidine-5'-phosphate decarboxylase